jgi:cupin superfamily acireductone dioxygenase involved in methionine salvage
MQNTPTFPIQLPEGAEPERIQDALKHLLPRVIDAREGHDAMLKRAEPKIAHLIRKFREEHCQHAEHIIALLAAVGGNRMRPGR